jgi:hypothetical protein
VVICLPVLAAVVALGLAVTRERRLRAECRRHLELLGEAAGKEAARAGGRYPYGPRAMEVLLLRHVHHRRYLICPKSRRTYHWTERARSTGDPAHLLLAWENPRAAGHGLLGGDLYALFVGGRVRAIDRRELDKLLAEEARQPPSPPRRPPRPRPGLREGPGEPPPGYLPKLPPGTIVPNPPAEYGPGGGAPEKKPPRGEGSSGKTESDN